MVLCTRVDDLSKPIVLNDQNEGNIGVSSVRKLDHGEGNVGVSSVWKLD